MLNKEKIFSDLYDKYINKIYRFVFLKVNSEEIAQDLCSETFLKTWKVFSKKDIDNVSAFLYKTAHNLTIDYYRKKGKIKFASLDNKQIPDPSIDLEEKAMLKSDYSIIEANLASLKSDDRELILLRYVEELSFSEIAQILDKSEATSRVQLHRALKNLKGKFI